MAKPVKTVKFTNNDLIAYFHQIFLLLTSYKGLYISLQYKNQFHFLLLLNLYFIGYVPHSLPGPVQN